jgi:hypothetical protein
MPSEAARAGTSLAPMCCAAGFLLGIFGPLAA